MYAFELTDFSDSSEIVPSERDVAHLRVAAHTEDKPPSISFRKLSPRALLDPEFQEIYNTTRNLPPFESETSGNIITTPEIGSPRLVEIGPGVFAVDTITNPTPSSIETDTRYGLDTLLSNPPQPHL